MQYLVLQTIWHTKDAKHYEPGERVSLDHLKPEEIKALVDEKVIALSEAQEITEVTLVRAPRREPRGMNTNTGEGHQEV